MSGCLGRALVVIAGVVGFYAFALLVWPPVLTATRTTLLMAEMVELPVRPLGWVTPAPTTTTLAYGERGDRIDVYLPADAAPGDPRPAVVLALGVHPQPIDSPDIVRIASAVARIGVVAAVPDSSALRELRLEATEPAHLADAVLLVGGLPEVDPDRVALAGFSAGASIALVAAADPRIANDLLYVSAFGGYADAEMLLVDVASRTTDPGGGALPWAPDEGIQRDLRALVRDAVGAEATRRLFGASSRAEAQAIVGSLPDGLRRTLAAVSPLGFVDRIRAPVYLLHGTPDTAIPVSHALLLAQALDDRLARITTFGRFGHGQPGEAGLGLEDAGDLVALLLHLHEIVAATTEWPTIRPDE